MKYSFITQHKNTYPISLQCQVLGVKRSGYYHYQASQARKREEAKHQEMLEWVKDIAESSGYSYGSRRMKKALNALSYPASRNKARQLMREAGVQARQRKKYKVTTNSNHKKAVYENLVDRRFDVPQTDQVYAADITSVWTQEGWLYLAVVMDLCSRKVVGWSMSSRMKAQLVSDALKMAIWQRRPKARLIHHSDRGSQYASHAFRRLLNAHGIKGSMRRKGDCWDTHPWGVSGTESKNAIFRFLHFQRLTAFENGGASLYRISFRPFWTETKYIGAQKFHKILKNRLF